MKSRKLLVAAEDDLLLPEIKSILDSFKYYAPKSNDPEMESEFNEALPLLPKLKSFLHAFKHEWPPAYFDEVTLLNEISLSAQYGEKVGKITADVGIQGGVTDVIKALRSNRALGGVGRDKSNAAKIFTELSGINSYLHIQVDTMPNGNLVHVRMYYTEDINISEGDDIVKLRKELFNSETTYFAFFVDITDPDYTLFLELGMSKYLKNSSPIPGFDLVIEGMNGLYSPQNDGTVYVEVGADFVIKAAPNTANLKYATWEWSIESITNPRSILGFVDQGNIQNVVFSEPGRFDILLTVDDGIHGPLTKRITIEAVGVPEFSIQPSQYAAGFDFDLNYEVVANDPEADDVKLEWTIVDVPTGEEEKIGQTWSKVVPANNKGRLNIDMGKHDLTMYENYTIDVSAINPRTAFRSTISSVELTGVPSRRVGLRATNIRIFYYNDSGYIGNTDLGALGIDFYRNPALDIGLDVILPINFLSLSENTLYELNEETGIDWGVAGTMQVRANSIYNSDVKRKPYYWGVIEIDFKYVFGVYMLNIIDSSERLRVFIYQGMGMDISLARFATFRFGAGIGANPTINETRRFYTLQFTAVVDFWALYFSDV